METIFFDTRRNFDIQCNLSTMATLGTAKTGCCREVTAVERSNISKTALWGKLKNWLYRKVAVVEM